jgi:hypothetical protein
MIVAGPNKSELPPILPLFRLSTNQVEAEKGTAIQQYCGVEVRELQLITGEETVVPASTTLLLGVAPVARTP